jgi:hypothetical protein
MRAINAIIVLALLLGGCEFFKPIKKETSQEQETNDACGDFCAAWVHATYNCLDVTDLCMDEIAPFDETRSECKDECVEIALELDESDLEDVTDCMWCVVDEIGTEPDCWDLYEDEWGFYFYVDECEWECEDVESMINKFNWPEQLMAECMDVF